MSHLISYVTTKYLKKSNEMRGMKQNKKRSTRCIKNKIPRGPKLEGCAFAKFGNSSGTEGEPSQKREKKLK